MSHTQSETGKDTGGGDGPGDLGADAPPPPAPSVHESARSKLSVGAIARRKEIEQARLDRLAAFEREEAERRVEEEMQLSGEDLESQAGGRLTEGAVLEHDADTLAKVAARLAELDLQRDRLLARGRSLSRVHDASLRVKTESADVKPALFVVPSGSRSLAGPLAEISSRVKIERPKPWKGSFLQPERDGWIRTAKGYLAAIGLDLNAILAESLAPLPYHTVRTLMSSDSPSSGIAPQQWFDSQNLRAPWTTASEVFSAMEKFWTDDLAEERAMATFRAARQGKLRAREFGALVETRAAACTLRKLTDADLKEVFLLGLQPTVRAYVDRTTRQAARAGASTAFHDAVDIAADLDDQQIVQAAVVTSAVKSPLPTSSSVAAVSANPSKSKGSTPAHWVEDATKWQAKNPVADKARWHQDPSSVTKAPHPQMQCYNCGERGHYSNTCGSARIAPKSAVVYIAGIKKLSSFVAPNPPSSSSSSSSESGKGNGE